MVGGLLMYSDLAATTHTANQTGLGLKHDCGSSAADPSGTRWYVVQTQPRREARAIANLQRQNYRVFCPCIRKTVRHARKMSGVLAALFPKYLFVRLDVSRE